MKLKLILFFTALSCYASAQTGFLPNTNLPVLVPPSPEIAELSRFMESKTNLFTGASNVEVPLYTLESGSLKTDVALAYSNNGLKVNDIPGRAGLGWNIIAGGSISRTVHDEPDEKSTFLPALDFSSTISDPAYLTYLRTASKYGNDTEHDLYNINVPGLSGKFYFDSLGTPRLINHSNIKIQITGSINDEIYTFIITNGDGIKYYFGESNKFEQTTDVVLSGFEPKFKVQRTSWFLTRIVSPEGHQISFNYSAIAFKSLLAPSQYVKLEPHFNPPISPCGECSGQWGLVTYNSIDYASYFLTSITSSSGQNVVFSYETRPDVSGDNRLTGVTATGQKRYIFKYFDVTGGTAITNKKFFLTKLLTLPLGETPTDTLVHKFEYESMAVPDQRSLSQDYYGYANSSMGSNLIPIVPSAANYIDANLGRDRKPNFSSAKIGAIKKVTYPTGGFEEFTYEPHTINKLVTETTWQSFHEVGLGTGYSTWVDNSFNFDPDQTQVITGEFLISERPNINPGDPNYHAIDGTHFVVRDFEIWDRTNNNRVFYKKEYSTTVTTTFTFNAIGGAHYEIKYRVCGVTPQGVVNFQYDPVTTTAPQNVAGCGIRVANIKSYDPIKAQANYRYFKYAALSDLETSSGVGNLGAINYENGPVSGQWCTMPNNPYVKHLNICETMLGVYGSPLSRPDFSGSPVAYKYVIESNAPDFTNGGTEHRFIGYLTGPSWVYILNQPSVNTSRTEEPDMNGLETGTMIFKKAGANFLPITETLTDYQTAWSSYKMANHTIRMMWDFNVAGDDSPPTLFTSQQKLAGFAVTGYHYHGGTIYQRSVVKKEYDDNGQNPTIDSVKYKYNADYTLQTRITNYNNLGDSIVTTQKYPVDYSTAPYTSMVAKNILNPVIEKISIKNTNTPIASTFTVYKDWFNDQKVFKPEIVKANIGNGPLENRIHFYNYDVTGNPVELSKENGARLVYIWDNASSFNNYDFLPIAEVTNATNAEVAYCSFEGSRKGNWTFSGLPQYDSNAPTGIYCYNLSGGSISKSGLISSTTYIVSYWTKNTSAYTIAGTVSGYPLKVRSKGGWSLYVHQITGVNNVTIANSGSGFIDELRLYPLNAQMKTFNYDLAQDIITTTDAKNMVSYFEYDGFKRLKNIRDQDGNILKNYTYNYLKIANEAKSGTFFKQCSNGIGAQVTYTVPAGTYTATTVEEANVLAVADVAANGQAYANANGACNNPYVRMLLTNGTVNGSGHTYFDHIIQVFADSACTQSYTLTSAMTVYYKKITTTIANGQPTITETNLSTNIPAGANSKSLGNLLINTCVNTQNQLTQTNPSIQSNTDTTGTNNNQAQNANTQQDGLTGTQQNINGGATTNGNAPPPGGGQNCAYSSYVLRPGTGYNLQGGSGGSGGGGGGLID